MIDKLKIIRFDETEFMKRSSLGASWGGKCITNVLYLARNSTFGLPK